MCSSAHLFPYTCIISYRDKANASNDTRRQLFFSQRKRRAASGGTRTHDVLHVHDSHIHVCASRARLFVYMKKSRTTTPEAANGPQA